MTIKKTEIQKINIQKIKNNEEIQAMKEDIKALDDKIYDIYTGETRDLQYIFLFLAFSSITWFFNVKEGFILFAIISIIFFAVNKLYISELEHDKKETEFLKELKKNNLIVYYENIEKIKKRMDFQEKINNF